MTPHNHTALLLGVLAVIVILTIQALRRRGMQDNLEPRPPEQPRPTTTRIQTVVKLVRHSGAKADFPKLRVMCKGPSMAKLDRVEVKAVRDDGHEARADAEVAPGTPINPEPGNEIDLSAAFRQVAAQLCDSFEPKTRVKYNVVLQQSIQGRTIPIETPQMAADLWPDGLQDIVST